MILQKSLNDRVAANDLRKSFITILPYSIVAFLVLCTTHIIPVLKYISSDTFKSKPHNNILLMFCEDSTVTNLIQIGMVLCGMIMAITLFRFLLTKKSVNVYLSFGITRSRLYFNRVFAAMLSIFAATFIPNFITLIINLSAFGYSSHLMNVFCYEFLFSFVSGISGFALGTVSMIISGCLAEALLVNFGLSLYSLGALLTVDSLKNTMLRGYIYSTSNYIDLRNKFYLFSIWNFAIDLDYDLTESSSLLSAIGARTELPLDKSVVVDLGVLLPLLVWIAISVVLIALGCLLINMRKSENSNSFGKIYLPSAINGATVFLVVLALCCNSITNAYAYSSTTPLYQNLKLCLLIIFAISLFVFIGAELIIKRNFKKTLKTLPVFAALFIISAFGITVISTGYFGSYNKLPEPDQIKSAAFDINDDRNIFNYGATAHKYYSENSKDIEKAVSLFNMIANDSYSKGDEYANYISFAFELTDGTTYERRFRVFTEDVYDQYTRGVYDTDYFKNYIKRLFVDINTETTDDEAENNYYGSIVYSSDTGEYTPGAAKNWNWYYVGNQFLVDNYSSAYGEGKLNTVENIDGLLEALYKDLITMSYDEIYSNDEKPICVLATNIDRAELTTDKIENNYGWLERTVIVDDLSYQNDYVQETLSSGVVYRFINVYPSMKNTIDFLNSQGETPLVYSGKIKEVYYCDSDVYPWKILKDSSESKYFSVSEGFSHGSYYYGYSEDENLPESILLIDYIKYTYEKSGNKLICISDADKSAQIVSKALPFYTFSNSTEKGRYIFAVYDDNTIIPLYVPASKLEVFFNAV